MSDYILALPKKSYTSADFPGIEFFYMAKNTLDWNYWHVRAEHDRDITLAALKGTHSYRLSDREQPMKALERFIPTLPQPEKQKAQANLDRLRAMLKNE